MALTPIPWPSVRHQPKQQDQGLIDWSLMALSAQIGYIVSLVAVEQVKLTRKLTMLRVGKDIQ